MSPGAGGLVLVLLEGFQVCKGWLSTAASFQTGSETHSSRCSVCDARKDTFSLQSQHLSALINRKSSRTLRSPSQRDGSGCGTVRVEVVFESSVNPGEHPIRANLRVDVWDVGPALDDTDVPAVVSEMNLL